MELGDEKIHPVRGSVKPPPSILPNDIIIEIIREAEDGYGGSHWRNHIKKFIEKQSKRYKGHSYSISLDQEIRSWNCYLCGARNSKDEAASNAFTGEMAIPVLHDYCFCCDANNEEIYYTYPKPPKDSAGYVSDYDSEEEYYTY